MEMVSQYKLAKASNHSVWNARPEPREITCLFDVHTNSIEKDIY